MDSSTWWRSQTHKRFVKEYISQDLKSFFFIKQKVAGFQVFEFKTVTKDVLPLQKRTKKFSLHSFKNDFLIPDVLWINILTYIPLSDLSKSSLFLSSRKFYSLIFSDEFMRTILQSHKHLIDGSVYRDIFNGIFDPHHSLFSLFDVSKVLGYLEICYEHMKQPKIDFSQCLLDEHNHAQLSEDVCFFIQVGEKVFVFSRLFFSRWVWMSFEPPQSGLLKSFKAEEVEKEVFLVDGLSCTKYESKVSW